jgi:hypothetical protein
MLAGPIGLLVIRYTYLRDYRYLKAALAAAAAVPPDVGRPILYLLA